MVLPILSTIAIQFELSLQFIDILPFIHYQYDNAAYYPDC